MVGVPLPEAVPLPFAGVEEVGGGVESEALAPVCAATCKAQVKERKKDRTIRQAIMIAIECYCSEGAKECGNLDKTWQTDSKQQEKKRWSEVR